MGRGWQHEHGGRPDRFHWRTEHPRGRPGILPQQAGIKQGPKTASYIPDHENLKISCNSQAKPLKGLTFIKELMSKCLVSKETENRLFHLAVVVSVRLRSQ